MKREFKLRIESDYDYGSFIAIDVVIDETEESKPQIKDMAEFWRGWERKLKEMNGDYTKTFLHYFGSAILGNKDNLHSLNSVVDYFNNEDGFYPLFKQSWFSASRFVNNYEEPEMLIKIEEF